MRASRWTTLCLLAFLLAGCGQQLAGQAYPLGSKVAQQAGSGSADGNGSTSQDPNGPLPASQLRISDPRSADLCSLVDTATLAQFGQLGDQGRSGFNGCEFAVGSCEYVDNAEQCESRTTNEVNGYVDISLDLNDITHLSKTKKLDPSTSADAVAVSKLTEETVAGHPVLKFPHLPSECSYAIPLNQQALITVNVSARNKHADGSDFCAIASTTVKMAVRTLAANDLATLPIPENSLAFVKLCEMLGASDVTVAGAEWSTSVRTDFGRDCFWRDQKKVALSINTNWGYVPSEMIGAKGPVDLAGRPTWTIPGKSEKSYYSKGTCTIKTIHLRGRGGAQDDQAELAAVRVTIADGAGTNLQPCAAAKTIAERVWPKLPAGS